MPEISDATFDAYNASPIFCPFCNAGVGMLFAEPIDETHDRVFCLSCSQEWKDELDEERNFISIDLT